MGGPAEKKGKKKAKPPKNKPNEENPFLVPRNSDAERERGRVVPVKVTPPEEKEPPKYSRGRPRNREPEPKRKMDDRISRLGTRWGRGRKPGKKKKG